MKSNTVALCWVNLYHPVTKPAPKIRSKSERMRRRGHFSKNWRNNARPAPLPAGLSVRPMRLLCAPIQAAFIASSSSSPSDSESTPHIDDKLHIIACNPPSSPRSPRASAGRSGRGRTAGGSRGLPAPCTPS